MIDEIIDKIKIKEQEVFQFLEAQREECRQKVSAARDGRQEILASAEESARNKLKQYKHEIGEEIKKRLSLISEKKMVEEEKLDQFAQQNLERAALFIKEYIEKLKWV